MIFASLLLGYLVFAQISSAHPGNTAPDGCHYCWTNCASWGEVYGERHCHGGGYYDYSPPTTPTCPLFSSYNSLSGQCECNYGYIASGGQCISTYTYCTNNYGIHSRYNSIYETCECSYGYRFNLSGTKCISTPVQTANPSNKDTQDNGNATIIGLGGAGLIGYGLYKYSNRRPKASKEEENNLTP